MQRKLSAWQRLVESFYDGRMLSIFRLKRIYADTRTMQVFTRKVDQQLALALSGVTPASKRRLWLLSLLLRYLNRPGRTARLRIS
jgi:truncated hemoglobin YjbI